MRVSLLICCALVAMAIPAYATGKDGAVSVSLAVNKDVAAPPAVETPNPSAEPNASAVPNPSAAPAETTTTGPQVALSGPVIDANVKKVPVVTLWDAPCQKVCKDMCSISLEKVCNKVPVTQKKCDTVEKPVIKRMCSKKCSYTTPAVEISSTPMTNANPSANTNPSAQANLGPSTPSDGSLGVDVTTSGSGSLSLSNGRKLQTILPLKAAVVQAVAGAVLGQGPNADCVDVCQDVASTVPDIVCQDFTTEVEKCAVVPKQTCQQECVCIPMATVRLNLPVKPIRFSVSGDGAASVGASTVTSASVDTMAGKGK